MNRRSTQWNRILILAIVLTAVVFIPASVVHADSEFIWAKGMGGPYYQEARDITADSAGNTYITGYFQDIVDFDPGPGVAELSSQAGSNDAFVVKLNPDGDFVWARRMGGNASEYGQSIGIDGAGNVYVVGDYEGTASFGPDPTISTLMSQGESDIFLVKLNGNGDFLWVKSLGGSGLEHADAIAIGGPGAGAVHLTGFFSNGADFDPGPAGSLLTTTGTNQIFVARYDLNGNLAWAKAIADGDYNSMGRDIAVDQNGYVYTTGVFSGQSDSGLADFDPGPGEALLTGGGGFILKLSHAGEYAWAKQVAGDMSGNGFGEGLGIAANSTGQVYISGYFRGTGDFDPGPGTLKLISKGPNDTFLLKLEADGNLAWAHSLQATTGKGIVVDRFDYVYLAGTAHSDADFDFGLDAVYPTKLGAAFVMKLEGNGNLLWAREVGGFDADEIDETSLLSGHSLAVDDAGNAYLVGSFGGTVDFDAGEGETVLSSNSMQDIYVAKLNGIGANRSPQTITFDPLPDALLSDGAVMVQASASSGLPVSFYSATPSTCSVQSNVVTFAAAGTCTVVATQAGNGAYGPAPARKRSFQVNQDAIGFHWLKTMGSNEPGSTSWQRVLDIGLDDAGNIYTLGAFNGLLTLQLETEELQLQSIAKDDFFLLKLNNAGTVLWAKQFGAYGYAEGVRMAVDGAGNTYIAGNYNGSFVFEGTPQNYTYNGVLVLKVSSNGSLVWAKSIGGEGSLVRAYGLAVDSAGHFILGGTFDGNVDFDPGAGTVSKTSETSSDLFVAKLTADGNLLWVQSLAGLGISALALDHAANIYLTGFFVGTRDFDPGPGEALLTGSDESNLFLARLDSNGNYLWAKNTGAVLELNTPEPSVAVDGGGNLLTIYAGLGTTSAGQNTMKFEPSVASFDPAGNLLWAGQTSGTGEGGSIVIATDAAGNFYLAGAFMAEADFGLNKGAVNFTSVGDADTFVAKFDGSGAYRWAKQIGGYGTDVGQAIAVDGAGNLYIAGGFTEEVYLDLRAGKQTLEGPLGGAFYVAKLGDPATAPQLSQTISFEPLPDRTLSESPFFLDATASSGLPVSFHTTSPAVCIVNGNQVTLVAEGTCTIVATQSGGIGYAAAPDVQHSFQVFTQVLGPNQTITFAPLPDRSLSEGSFVLNATASSGLTVYFATTTPEICTVEGDTVYLIAPGICTIVASQPGSEQFNPAPDVSQSFQVHLGQVPSAGVFLPLVRR